MLAFYRANGAQAKTSDILIVVGFAFFLLFAGIFNVVLALMNRQVDLWWMRLILGIVEIGFGFWCAGSFQRSAIFLVSFVAVATLFRGITQIIQAFQLRKLDPKQIAYGGSPA